MPKVVDVPARRAELAEAVWRVIRREGLERASVRNVAREAGLSMGALRHYFGTQDELLVFAMQRVMDRARARVTEAAQPTEDARSRAVAMLEEVLPLDDERRAEAQVWLALTARSMVVPALASVRDQSYDDLQRLCHAVVDALLDDGPARPGVDVPTEVERLYALLDGLALHAVIRPRSATPELIRAVLARHLDAITGGRRG